MVYDDEKIVDEQTAQKMNVLYGSLQSKATVQNIQPQISAPSPTTNQLLAQILFELRAIRCDLEKRKNLRLRF